ncbi:hypothetical protein Aperf_G00000000817 [Anoplocephala perfoliata]
MKTCLRLMLILFMGILLAVGAEKTGISVKSEMENHTVPCRCDCEPDKDKHCEICNACLKKLTKKFPSPTEDALTDIEQQSCRNQHPGEKLARGTKTVPCASPLLRPVQNKSDPRLQPDQGILKILLHPVDTMNVSVRYTILKTMPNIPSNLANFLKDMEPGFVQYIINNHEDLAPLLLAMDKSSIQYVSLHVPEFGLRVSELDTVPAQLVFSQVSRPCGYLTTLSEKVSEVLITKVPQLRRCLGHTSGTILSFANRRKLNKLRLMHEDFSSNLIEVINTHSNLFNMNLEAVTAKNIKEFLNKLSKEEPFFSVLAHIF